MHLLGSAGCGRCRQLRASENLEHQWRASIGVGIRSESPTAEKNEFDCGRCEIVEECGEEQIRLTGTTQSY